LDIDSSDKPLIVNTDFTVLLETRSASFIEARDQIARFLELRKSPAVFHTYSINEISLWNGFSVGLDDTTVITILKKYSKFPVPEVIISYIQDQFRNFGIVKLEKYDNDTLQIICEDPYIIGSLMKTREIGSMAYTENDNYFIPAVLRGIFKLEMIKLGFPVNDCAGYINGGRLSIRINTAACIPRDYQTASVNAFFGSADEQIGEASLANSGVQTVHNTPQRGGEGVIVLPCGAGKTIVGMIIMSKLSMKTLIVTPNIVALRQWKSELIEKTNLSEEDIGEYSGEEKTIRPVTIATYQILIYRRKKNEAFAHLKLFSAENWGLLIYDEVHLLPAPVFRAITSIQALRRLGLTATLVREDNKERDVFALIGPKKFDKPWKELEKEQFIANAVCFEIRVPVAQHIMNKYFSSDEKSQFRIAAENPEKIPIVSRLIDALEGHQILIIGQYLDQLFEIARTFSLPIITGKTPNLERQNLYRRFRKGLIKILVVSKVANFAIDLPDADVAIQISGTFGSRQEEAQRLGRIIRPKPGLNKAYFFSLVSKNTSEEIFGHNRKRFLMEQGYEYHQIKSNIFDGDTGTLRDFIGLATCAAGT